MNEHAGVHITVGIDVQIPAAAGNTATHILRVVLEVHGEQGLLRPVLPDAVIGSDPLLRRGQQLRRSVIAHRHIVEVPNEIAAQADQLIEERLRGNGLEIGAGVAGGNPVDQLFLVQQIDGLHDLAVHAVAAPTICGALGALQGNRGDKVLHPQHLVRKSLVDQCGVGKAEENAVGVLFTKADQVLLAYQRLTASVDVHVDAQLLTLLDNAVDLLVGQVQLVAVLSGPAAGAVEVAGTGGVQKNGPWNIAAIFLAALLLLGPSNQGGVDKEVHGDGLHNLRVDVCHQPLNEGIIGVLWIRDCLADKLPLRFKLAACKLIRPIHQLYEIFFRILIQVVESLLQSEFFDCC